MIRRSLGLVALVAGVVLIACGNDDGSTAKYPSAESFCSAKAEEECKVAAAPCTVNDATCKGKRVSACTSETGAANVQGRSYDPAKAETCIAKTIDVYKDRVVDPVKAEAYEEACARVFVGKKKKNERCVNAFECEGSLVCDLGKGSVCAEKVDKKENEPCANPGETCEKGFFCHLRDSVRVCTAKQKEGEDCGGADLPCEEDLRCSNQCVAKVSAGDPCDTNEQCVTGLCNSAKKCTARQYPSETGTCVDFGGT